MLPFGGSLLSVSLGIVYSHVRRSILWPLRCESIIVTSGCFYISTYISRPFETVYPGRLEFDV